MDAVSPGSPNNPANVQILEHVMSEDLFKEASISPDPANTYTNLLKAAAKYPAFCKEEVVCAKELAVLLAHASQSGSSPTRLKPKSQVIARIQNS